MENTSITNLVSLQDLLKEKKRKKIIIVDKHKNKKNSLKNMTFDENVYNELNLFHVRLQAMNRNDDDEEPAFTGPQAIHVSVENGNFFQ